MKPNIFEIEIDITQDDIKYGVPMSCHNCPAARALARIYPDNWTAIAGSYATLDLDDKQYRSIRSKELLEFTSQYDGYLTKDHVVPTKIKLTFVEQND